MDGENFGFIDFPGESQQRTVYKPDVKVAAPEHVVSGLAFAKKNWLLAARAGRRSP